MGEKRKEGERECKQTNGRPPEARKLESICSDYLGGNKLLGDFPFT